MSDPSETHPDQSPAPQLDAMKENTPMEIHKPKPVHNWRELLSEIGVIVIGVLIALGAEQAVEAIHWHNQVADARTEITTEIAKNLRAGLQRMQTFDCNAGQLDSLAQILDAASRSGVLPPVGPILAPSLNTWPHGVWDSTIASQTAAHFPREDFANLTNIYSDVGRAQYRDLSSSEAWAEISTMSGAGRKLDGASEAELRKAISLARLDNLGVAIASLRMMQAVQQLHMAFAAQDMRGITRAEERPLNCPSPIPVAAPQSEVSNPPPVVQELHDALKHLPVLDAANR